jgi:hypothetical protein
LIVGAAKSYTNEVRLGKYPQPEAKHANGAVPPQATSRKMIGGQRQLATR